MIFFLLFCVGVAGYMYHNRSKKQHAVQGTVLRALQDSFAYLPEQPFTVRDVENLLHTHKSPSKAAQALSDAIETEAIEGRDSVLLGIRAMNLNEGMKLENAIHEWQNGIKTTEAYRAYKREELLLQTRLETWHSLAEITPPVVLPKKFRDRHLYVIGKSGSGKSKLIAGMCLQDIYKGNGVCFITPETETIEQDLLLFIPENRLNDVVYFNPSDLRCKYSMNPFEVKDGEDIDLKTDEIYTILSRILAEEMSPRIGQILRYALQTLIELPNTTLEDIPRLLDRGNEHFRKMAIATLKDQRAKKFWRDTYPTLPVNADLPILTRIEQLIRSKRIRNVLCQKEGGLDLKMLMDHRKILFVNLNEGGLGESTSRLLGAFLISHLQLATMRRASEPSEKRVRFYCYVDEFATFTGASQTSFEKMLARARKYKVPLVLAHQQSSQIPPNLLKEILGNVSTVVCFNVSAADASVLSKEFILENGERVDTKALVTQDIGFCHVKIGHYAFRMKTLLHTLKPNAEIKKQLIRSARREKPLSENSGEVKADENTAHEIKVHEWNDTSPASAEKPFIYNVFDPFEE